MKMLANVWSLTTDFDSRLVFSRAHNTRALAGRAHAALFGVCARIGAGLRSLKIDCNAPVHWADDLRLLAEKCPNIERIEWIYERDDGVNTYCALPANTRFDVFPKLTGIVFCGVREYAFAGVEVIRSLPPSLEVLAKVHIRDAFETPAQLASFFRAHLRLREVDICLFEFKGSAGNDELFATIASECKELKSLTIYDDSVNGSTLSMRGIELLEDMKKLDLMYCCGLDDHNEYFLTDEQATEVCRRNSRLESLKLEDRGRYLSFRGLRSIAALGSLRVLHLGGVGCTRVQLTRREADVFVEELAQNSGQSLEVFVFFRDVHLGTLAIEALASGCPRLRQFTFMTEREETSPEAIRLLIDSVVGSPFWNASKDTFVLQLLCPITAFDRPHLKDVDTTAAPPGVQLDISRAYGDLY